MFFSQGRKTRKLGDQKSFSPPRPVKRSRTQGQRWYYIKSRQVAKPITASDEFRVWRVNVTWCIVSIPGLLPHPPSPPFPRNRAYAATGRANGFGRHHWSNRWMEQDWSLQSGSVWILTMLPIARSSSSLPFHSRTPYLHPTPILRSPRRRHHITNRPRTNTGAFQNPPPTVTPNPTPVTIPRSGTRDPFLLTPRIPAVAVRPAQRARQMNIITSQAHGH